MNRFKFASHNIREGSALQKVESRFKNAFNIDPCMTYRATQNAKLVEATFDNTKDLNAATSTMLSSISEKISEWELNKTQAVWLQGQGRSFCAGGDIKQLLKLRNGTSDDPLLDSMTEYWPLLYSTEYKLSQMNPIQISVWDGYCMGTGAGLSMNGDIKIATEKTLFGMPEAKIGLHCDASAGKFLSNLRNGIGCYMALTGNALKSEDVMKAGIADFFVPSEHLPSLKNDIETLLEQNDFRNDKEMTQNAVKTCISRYAVEQTGEITNERLVSQAFNNKRTAQEVYEYLQENSSDVKFYADCLKQIDKNSPIAMAVNFEKLKKHKDLSLKRVFESENSLSLKFVAQNDFWEGIRCMLVDRKSLPNWQFENLSAIPQSEVDWYFEEPSWVAQDLQM